MKQKKKIFKTNKIFLVIAATALIIGGVIYFGFREFTQISNQLASLQEQVTLLLETPVVPATSTTASEESGPAAPEGDEPSPEPSGLESEINPCDYLNCDNLDGWTNSGSTFTCQDANNKTCTCQTQIYHDYSCSSLNQRCFYSTTDTRTYKYNCVEPEPEPEPEPTPYPDLIIQSPGFSPAVPVAGDEMFFWATLKNQGEGSADSSLSYLRIDGQKLAEFSTVSLASNESIVVAWSISFTAAAGQHELEVCADGALAVTESNEINNCTEITFTVTGTGAEETILLPDLIIESVDFSPDPLTAGQIVNFSGTVKNQGEASAKPSLTILRLDLGNDGDWDVFPGAVSTQTLAINESRTEIWRDVWTSAAGTHKIEICADAVSEFELRVVESNETNNCLSRVVIVP